MSFRKPHLKNGINTKNASFWAIMGTFAGLAVLQITQFSSVLEGLSSRENAVTDGLRALTNDKFGKIEEIAVIGERNSGTRWTVSHLGKCFNHTLKVREALVRHKHWFQHDVPNGRERVGTFVVSQFRDPYYWVEAMRIVTHHAPKHCCKLPWQEFVSKEWNMERLPSDIALKRGNETLGIPTSKIECQEYFSYDQINSCQLRPYPDGYFDKKPPMSGHQPQYEMRNDGSGLPYNNILELRADKIKNHLSVSEFEWVKVFVPLQYEELLGKGTEFLVRRIEKATGVQAKCDPYPAQNRPKRPLNKSFIEYLTKNLDWEAEKLVGYVPRDSETLLTQKP